MLPYSPIPSDYSKRKDIFDAIKMSGKFTPGNVIDIIKDHDEMHFSSKKITYELTTIILTAHNLSKHKTAEYIVNEFSHEIDFSYLAFQSIKYQLDAYILDDYIDKIEIKSDMITLPTAIVLQVLKSTDEAYFEVLLDNRDIINALTQRNIVDMFSTFTSRLMRKPEIAAKWKIILNDFSEINKTMAEIASDDIDLLTIFYPSAAEIFTF